jgi:hypothetical protein
MAKNSTEDAVPGYEERKRIREVLPELDRKVRTAFAVACAARVEPVIERYFPQKRELFLHAIDLCWQFALGKQLDETDFQQTTDACNELVEKLYEDDEGSSATLYSLDAILFALETTTKLESRTAERASGSAQTAAQIGDPKNGPKYIREEVDWQMQALEVARGVSIPSRTMFQHLPNNPSWLQALRGQAGS